MKKKDTDTCTSREDAQKIFADKLNEAGFFDNIPTETISVADALDRVLAQTAYAKVSVPHYNGSAMDGIAVYAPDTIDASENSPVRLKILKEGEDFEKGCCFIVDTGDMIPNGTNAVIMIERVKKDGNYAEISAPITAWKNIRIIGEDVAAGELVIPEFRVLSPTDIAALLSTGHVSVEVLKKPKVAIIPTGDEIVGVDVPLKPGMIRDSNSYMIAAAVRKWGGEADRFPILKDKKATIRSTVQDALEKYDIVLVLAGTSAGRDDYTSDVLASLGEVLVHGVSVKPGSPAVLAVCQGKPVIGVPGYPVSAMLIVELFLKNIVIKRHHMNQKESLVIDAFMAKTAKSSKGAEEYMRVSLGKMHGKLIASPLGRGAGALSALSKAQGMLKVEPDVAEIGCGDKVKISLLRDNNPFNTVLAVGSNDTALELLGIYLSRKRQGSGFTSINVGSMGGITAIKNNEAHIAGIHIFDPETGEYNVRYAQSQLDDGSYRLVHFANRQQGLIVAPGNPKKINGYNDLTRSDVRFVNRQKGSGTRMLLDYELEKNGIKTADVDGYEMEVSTHMAVAASVASGNVDAGLGSQAAANALGLSFIPLKNERYDLIVNSSDDEGLLNDIISILKSKEFRKEVETRGGYDMSEAGKIII